MLIIEEYKTLRDEIGRNQNLMAKTVQTGVTISSGLVASSFFSENYGWILVFVPTLFLIPIVIGRYIEFCLEPTLGLGWETFTRHFFGDPKKSSHSKYSLTTALPLLALQVFSPLFALIKYDKINYLSWASFYLVALILVLSEFLYLQNFALKPESLNSIKETLKLIKK